jgi:hypothetical protein
MHCGGRRGSGHTQDVLRFRDAVLERAARGGQRLAQAVDSALLGFQYVAPQVEFESKTRMQIGAF